MSSEAPVFKGEDESAGEAPPALDLIAAVFLCALGLFFGWMSVSLPVPGKVLSAPGLLPFLTSASLALMSVLLGLSAWKRRYSQPFMDWFWGSEDKGRLWAIVTIVAYVATLDALALEGFVDLLGFQFPLGSFEPATIVAMSVLLRVFWTDRLFPILVMAIGWTLCLSLSFRGLFNIPLPG